MATDDRDTHDSWLPPDPLESEPENAGGWEDFLERSQTVEEPSFEYTPPPEPHPWRRWIARSVDYLIGAFALGALLAFVPTTDDPVDNLLLGFGFQFIGIVILAVLLSATGTTPGKWLLGIRVRDASGMRPSLKRSLDRETRVVVQGLGLSIPIVSLFTMVMSKHRLERTGATAWDERLGLEVLHSGLSWGRGILCIAILLVIGGLMAVGSSPVLMTPWLEAELNPISESIRVEVEKAGGVMREIERVSGQLDDGGSQRFPLQFDRELVTVIATCDGSCMDMDLTLIGPGSDTLALDHEADAYPFIDYAVSVPGVHDLVVDMHNCEMEPCAFVAQVLRYDLGSAGIEGTCFVVSPDGIVATANHVVQGATTITVGFWDGTEVSARILTTADSSDVALLATDAERSGWLGFADHASLTIGDRVFTLGYPAASILGNEVKFTEGSISSLTGPGGDAMLLQTSTPVQPGNSGGPLMNERGEVVGMIVSMAESEAFYGATGALPQNVNWAVRGDLVSGLLPHGSRPAASIAGLNVVERAVESICWVDVE